MITNGDSLIAAFASADLFPWNKIVQGGATTAGIFASMWSQQGNPVAGSVPTTATTCTRATTGAVPFTNPTSPALTYLGYFTFENVFSSTFQLMVQLKDRLSHMGGLSGTNTGVQTVNLTLPSGRLIASNLSNVQWLLEVYTGLGATPQTLTVTYVNTASATNTVAVSIPASIGNGYTIPIIPTVAGDVIQSITSCQLGGSTGTVGNFGFTAARHIVQSALVSSQTPDILDVITTGLSQIADDSCLWFLIASSVSAWLGQGCNGSLKLIQG